MKNFKLNDKNVGQLLVNKIENLTNKYNKLCEKNPRKGTMLTIGVTLGFAFIVLVGAKIATTEEVITIADNKAEEAYFKSDYDTAITEYNNLQKEENDGWPEWQVKSAEVHSIKGEYEKSNSLLEDAYEKRNAAIDKFGYEKYAERDRQLSKDIVFIALMNGDEKRALEYGEMMLSKKLGDKELYRTMTTVYMLNGERDKAIKLIEEYPVSENSPYDMSMAAYLNIMVDNWDRGFELLNKAWYANKDEIKVFDVISQVAVYNNDELLRRLVELSEKNPEDFSYKMWLAKVYSMLPESSPHALEILETIDKEKVGSQTYKMIEAKILQNTGKEEEAQTLIDEIISHEKKSFLGYHVAAWNEYEKGNYKKAFEYCEQSILENKEYADNYGFLIPEILMKDKQEAVAEPYFRRALSLEPFNYNIMLKIADYYWVTKENLEEAYHYMNLASKLRPNDSEIAYKKGLIQISRSKVAEAEVDLKKAVEINGANTKYLRTLGTFYLNNGRNDEAIKTIRDAYEIDKSDPKTLNNAAVYYISITGEVSRAYENMKSAYEKINDNMDDETKGAIANNFAKVKEVYESYNRNDGSSITVPDLVIFY